ncbi:hypothetical protein CLA18_18895 [Pseudomonas protegens]|nr:hypothetical protein CLA18_18895 [Pseudomonas protegens]
MIFLASASATLAVMPKTANVLMRFLRAAEGRGLAVVIDGEGWTINPVRLYDDECLSNGRVDLGWLYAAIILSSNQGGI